MEHGQANLTIPSIHRRARASITHLRRKRREAVPGLIRDHHRFLLNGRHLTIDHVTERIRGPDARIQEATRPYSAAIELLESIPGVARRSAVTILAETGDADMSKFPTAGHSASWARVCPGNHESAGQLQSASTGKGNAWLRAALSHVGWAAVGTKGNYYRGPSPTFPRLPAIEPPRIVARKARKQPDLFTNTQSTPLVMYKAVSMVTAQHPPNPPMVSMPDPFQADERSRRPSLRESEGTLPLVTYYSIPGETATAQVDPRRENRS